VIAGKYRSRRLHSAPGLVLRPTSDRLRETLFNVLTAGNAGVLEGTTWIDLYAGTGAVGIEALSRGAGTVYFVDAANQAINLIRENVRSLEINAAFEIIQHDAARGLRALGTRSVAADFIFLDPPYQLTEGYSNTLERLAQSAVLKSGGIVIAEHLKKFDPGGSFGALLRYRKLEQGDSALSFYRRKE
jgi:16S rRNA (guanine(966)-N(2))-methyltransferase RsmD